MDVRKTALPTISIWLQKEATIDCTQRYTIATAGETTQASRMTEAMILCRPADKDKQQVREACGCRSTRQA